MAAAVCANGRATQTRRQVASLAASQRQFLVSRVCVASSLCSQLSVCDKRMLSIYFCVTCKDKIGSEHIRGITRTAQVSKKTMERRSNWPTGRVLNTRRSR